MKILVCGGRDFDDFRLLTDELTALSLKHTIDLVIHGGARGADTLAGLWAKTNKIPVQVFMADWNKYKSAAGHIRNKKMLLEGKPDLVVAFPGGKGTANMIGQAEDAGVTVIRL